MLQIIHGRYIQYNIQYKYNTMERVRAWHTGQALRCLSLRRKLSVNVSPLFFSFTRQSCRNGPSKFEIWLVFFGCYYSLFLLEWSHQKWLNSKSKYLLEMRANLTNSGSLSPQLYHCRKTTLCYRSHSTGLRKPLQLKVMYKMAASQKRPNLTSLIQRLWNLC